MLRLHNVLKSSRAAIDLASIMVGIIIIGLIGGVIAATVFAVIPWSQDKAAKQQLESIHTAENALYGLSSDSNVALQGGATRASFGSSMHLNANDLLTLDKTGRYCVISAAGGKDYHAYVKSGSGKWFSATNAQKSATLYAGSTPCVNESDTPVGSGTQAPGTVDIGVDDGSGNVPTEPAGPVVNDGSQPYIMNPADGFGSWSPTSQNCTVQSKLNTNMVISVSQSITGCDVTQTFATIVGKKYTFTTNLYGTRGLQYGWGDNAGVLNLYANAKSGMNYSSIIDRLGTRTTVTSTFIATETSTKVWLRTYQSVQTQNLPYTLTFSNISLTPAP